MRFRAFALFLVLALLGAGLMVQPITAQEKGFSVLAQPRAGERRTLPQYPEIVIGPGSQISVFSQGRLREKLLVSPEVARAFSKLRGTLSFARVAASPDDLCYAMRSYQFERYDGGDATRLVNQRTCTPASRFRAKSAVAKPK